MAGSNRESKYCVMAQTTSDTSVGDDEIGNGYRSTVSTFFLIKADYIINNMGKINTYTRVRGEY